MVDAESPLTEHAENSVGKQRGRPFPKGRSGNPSGKPRGARNRLTILAESILDGEGEALLRKCIESALAGEPTALRLCIERIIPPRRDRPIRFRLPPLHSAQDAPAAMNAVALAVAAGNLTPIEATGMTKLIEGFVRATEAYQLEQRVRALEELAKGKR
jgi:Family of unknown function (DUF5681)